MSAELSKQESDTDEPTDNPSKEHRIHKKAVAIAAGMAAIAGMAVPPAMHIAAQQRSIKANSQPIPGTPHVTPTERPPLALVTQSDDSFEFDPSVLFKPDQLPGSNMAVSQDTVNELAASTVSVLHRPKNSNAAWVMLCSGVKIEVHKQDFISWDAACDQTIESTIEKIDMGVAVNILPYSKDALAIARPNETTPLTGVSASAAALGEKQGLLLASGSPAYDAIPAIPENKLDFALAVSGQQMRPVGESTQASGVYLGSPKDSSLDVTMYMGTPDNHVLRYAGSSAALSNGTISGPLSDIYPSSSASVLEKMTGVDLSGFTDTYAYTTFNQDTLDGLAGAATFIPVK